MFSRLMAVLGGLCLSVTLILAGGAQAQTTPPKKPEPQTLSFRFLGPREGNRVAALAGVPGDPNIWYAGAASGGVFKSTDGGFRWNPIFDEQSAAAIGTLAVAPSDPNTVWAGTGEAWAIRDIDVGGDGVYKSTDAGKTWTNMGLPASGRVGRIVIDPKDAGVVYVCALGRMTAPQQERGVFKTTDGGKTWTRSLFVDPKTGCSGLAMDAHDSKTLFAGAWQVEMHTYAERSGGPGSGVYVSHDAGATWARIDGHGLPVSPFGKVDVAVAPTDSQRVYALIETNGQGSLWRSDDGGGNWAVVSTDRTLIGRAGYYIRVAVSPADKDTVFVSSSVFHVSTDGGKTFQDKRWGGDNHEIWFDPTNAKRFGISFDGGLAITTNGGEGMRNVTLPIGQMYHVAVDDQIPYRVYSNMQDNGTMRMPLLPFGQNGGQERTLGGCESGFTLPDPHRADVVWASCYGAEVTRWDGASQRARSVSPWLHSLSSPPADTRYRCHWTAPLAADPFDPDTVYFGCQMVLKTADAGQSWHEVSPDLSTRDPSRLIASGGVIGDNLGQFYGEVVFAIAPSPIQKGLIWAGTNDGKIWLTTKGGGQWTDVTANVRGLPVWGTITAIQPSAFDPAVAYVSVDAHLMDDPAPYIFKTTDFGKTWAPLSANLPKGPLAYVRNVSEDPNQKGLLFAGTGNALYYSLNDGGAWTRLKDGLPPVQTTWTVVQKRFHDLVVSTYGRGLYVLDDITPLEEMARRPTTEAVRLFPARPTWRFGRGETAFINFALQAAPKDPVKVEILDASGKVVRTLTQPAKAGLNRFKWNLRWDDIKTIQLQTVPPEDPNIWQESRFKGKTSRPIFQWGVPARQQGPFVAPGTYAARLTVDGQSFTTPLEVLIDPASPAPQTDIEAMVRLQLRVRDDIGAISSRVNLIEQMRHQIETWTATPTKDPGQLALLKAMDARLQAVEYEMFSKDLAPSDDKFYTSAYKVYFNLIWLNAELGGGALDVAGGFGHGPTAPEVQTLDLLEGQLKTAEAHYDALMAKDVAAFNAKREAKGMASLTLTLAPAKVDDDAGPYQSDDDDDDFAEADRAS
jgi:photosystem II stability/assembly factor-like uncharacterized protein